MAKIFRFRLESAVQVCLAEAQAQGMPVQMDAVRNGLTNVVSALYQKYGIGLSVDETSPYYQNFVSQLRGQQVSLRPPPVTAPGTQIPAVAVPQANQWPTQQIRTPAPPTQAPFPMQPLPTSAVLPGQPLPPLQPPPHLSGQTGVRQGHTGAVPVQAPIMPMSSGELPSLSSPPPTPRILE